MVVSLVVLWTLSLVFGLLLVVVGSWGVSSFVAAGAPDGDSGAPEGGEDGAGRAAVEMRARLVELTPSR